MTIKFTRRRIIACVAVFAVAVLVPIALHAASSPGTLEACVNPGNGMMRLVDSSTACHNNETRVEWNITGPQGPPGDPGPQGPPGSSSGGPPFVWVCTPARFSNAGSNAPAELYVFNGGSSAANVSVNFLDKSGNNLAGHNIPGSPSPGTYPGEANGVNVPLAAATTRDLYWMMPIAAGPGFDGVTDVSFSIRIVSDQPIVVGARFDFHPFEMPQVCHALPK
jgi:hypothetical protein